MICFCPVLEVANSEGVQYKLKPRLTSKSATTTLTTDWVGRDTAGVSRVRSTA